MEHTTNPEDILTLPDPDDYRLPEQAGTAPLCSLAAPLVKCSYDHPPLDHDGVRIPPLGPDDAPSVHRPHDVLVDQAVIKCTKMI